MTGQPYSGTEILTRVQNLAGGNTITNTESTKVYRDAQGRTRTEQTITPPAGSTKTATTRITISDPVSGVAYVLDSATMTGRQFNVPRPPATPPPARPDRPTPPNVTVTNLGPQTINGDLCNATQRVETIPAGTIGNAQAITNTRFTCISTDLSVPVSIKTSDYRSGTSDMELTAIVKVAPDPSLFVVPAGYTIQQGGGRGPGGGGQRGAGRRGPNPQ